MKSVFCDESGFTGDNLWQSEQPYFVYAAVAIDDDEAREIVQSARREYSIRASEFHASKLLKRKKGQEAIRSIVEKIMPSSSVAIFHKRYSLAGKMFEYLIEPAVSHCSTVLYNIGFHKFVANGLYFAMLADPTRTGGAFQEFQAIMRAGDVSRLGSLIDGLNNDGVASFLGHLSTVITCNRRVIESEIVPSEDCGSVPRWMLELTTTAMMSLLATMSGEAMVPLSVTCDDSKPLLSQAEMFESLIGRGEFREVHFDERSCQLTFNLAHDIRFGSSKMTPGIQLADVVASAAAFSLTRPEDEFSVFWRENCTGMVHQNSVLPDVQEFDLSTERAVVNAFVLGELAERSVLGQDLVYRMPEYIHFARQAAREYLLGSE